VSRTRQQPQFRRSICIGFPFRNALPIDGSLRQRHFLIQIKASLCQHYSFEAMKRVETIPNTRSALLRAVVIVLSLALAMSGMAHAAGLPQGGAIELSLPLTTTHGVAAADNPCENRASLGVNDACSSAPGCAFGIPEQETVADEPLQHDGMAPAIAEVQLGTTALPPIRPPKLFVQA
jgi:hypothetical protein